MRVACCWPHHNCLHALTVVQTCCMQGELSNSASDAPPQSTPCSKQVGTKLELLYSHVSTRPQTLDTACVLPQVVGAPLQQTPNTRDSAASSGGHLSVPKATPVTGLRSSGCALILMTGVFLLTCLATEQDVIQLWGPRCLTCCCRRSSKRQAPVSPPPDAITPAPQPKVLSDQPDSAISTGERLQLQPCSTAPLPELAATDAVVPARCVTSRARSWSGCILSKRH